MCTLEPLRVAAYPGHPLAEHSILALATISKVGGEVVVTSMMICDSLSTSLRSGLLCR